MLNDESQEFWKTRINQYKPNWQKIIIDINAEIDEIKIEKIRQRVNKSSSYFRLTDPLPNQPKEKNDQN